MGSDCYRFDHCTIIQRHVCRKQNSPVLWHDEIILGSTISMEGLYLQVLADIVKSLTAWTALAAHKLRTGSSLVARSKAFYSFAHSDNNARVFMTLHHRIDA